MNTCEIEYVFHWILIYLCVGTGGEEAALFTLEMFSMYQKYATIKGWKFEILEQSEAEHGGLKVSESSPILYASYFSVISRK